MADIVSIAVPEGWFLRERPTSAKFSADITTKINALIANQRLINTGLETLLQGATGGAEQAVMSMGMASAPTGWTRRSSATDDTVLLTASAGAVSSGGWTVTGMQAAAAGAHTHDLGAHTHDLAHSHTASAHTHTMVHSHDVPAHTHNSYSSFNVTSGAASGTTTTAGWTFVFGFSFTNSPSHVHTFNHTHTMGTATAVLDSTSSPTASSTPTVSSYSSASGAPSSDTTDSAVDHTHDVFSGQNWRPSYLNMIICEKD